MNRPESNPLDDPQLAETWSALAHLAAAAEGPFDEQAFASRLLGHVARRERRTRLVIGGGALAAAAALLLMASFAFLATRNETAVAIVMPEEGTSQIAVVAEAADPEQAGPFREPGRESVNANALAGESPNPPLEIAPWEDELAGETASLADQMQALEKQWRERPDSFALFQSQVDQFEQEIKGGEL